MRTRRPECHTEGRSEEGPSRSFWAHSPVQETEKWVTTIGYELALWSKCWEGKQGWNWGASRGSRRTRIELEKGVLGRGQSLDRPSRSCNAFRMESQGVVWGRMLGNQVEASSLDEKEWDPLLWLSCSPGSPAPKVPSIASFLPGSPGGHTQKPVWALLLS